VTIRIKPGGSHPSTNRVVFSLIQEYITKTSVVLDFGAGQGHMSQKVGDHFKALGRYPRDHLHACEVAPECFQYEAIECRKAPSDSTIPFPDRTFDLIYAIEVLEHLPRPYDFFIQAAAKLKTGGVLLFTTPNILHFKSRLGFLLTGYGDFYGPLSIRETNAGRICGHIMPLSYSNFHYGLRKAGFSSITFHVDRRKKSALIPALIFYPFLKIASYAARRKLNKYDADVYAENETVVPFMNSLDVLSSRSCILVSRKYRADRP
jgi:SAM-dependent methyltransferase